MTIAWNKIATAIGTLGNITLNDSCVAGLFTQDVINSMLISAAFQWLVSDCRAADNVTQTNSVAGVVNGSSFSVDKISVGLVAQNACVEWIFRHWRDDRLGFISGIL